MLHVHDGREGSKAVTALAHGRSALSHPELKPQKPYPVGVVLGLYRDNGKHNGNHHLGSSF